jgi:hypothetical protein
MDQPVTSRPVGPGATEPTLGPIGDGSTAYTGPQPHQPDPALLRALRPGERPPQLVVVSWDGAGETTGEFAASRALASTLHGSMTFFLSGIYTLPASRRTLYQPPGRSAGASDIPFLSDGAVRRTIEQTAAAWLDGNEIGTHFNGHFCGPRGGGGWTPAQWDAEIGQAVSLVTSWRTNTGLTDVDPLPFDYRRELAGGRTPCLDGRAGLVQAAAVRAWRYDSSGIGLQVWPRKDPAWLWYLPMSRIPFPGRTFEVGAMDYNFMANQSASSPDGDPAQRPAWQEQVRAAYLAGFQRAYDGNRAPLVIGNHFESWNGGIYLAALREALTQMAGMPDVRFVSFRQLCDWLDAQDPAVLASWQALNVGQAPSGGWSSHREAQ